MTTTPESVDDYLDRFPPEAAGTARAILTLIRDSIPGLDLVIAWNVPMLKAGSGYVLGLSIARRHITIGPWGDDVIGRFADRLEPYAHGTKSFNVPFDWPIDTTLLLDLVGYRLAEFG